MPFVQNCGYLLGMTFKNLDEGGVAYVWFYPDYNFISTSEGNPYTKSTEEIRSFFS